MALIKIFLNTSNVKIMLTKRNKSQKELANYLQINPTYVNQLINHQFKFTIGPNMRKKIMIFFTGKKWDDVFILKDKGIENNGKSGI